MIFNTTNSLNIVIIFKYDYFSVIYFFCFYSHLVFYPEEYGKKSLVAFL